MTKDDIARLREQYGERLERLSGIDLGHAIWKLCDEHKEVANADTDLRDLAAAEWAWLTTPERRHAYNWQLYNTIVGPQFKSPDSVFALCRLLPPDVCCRCLLLAAGECE